MIKTEAHQSNLEEKLNSISHALAACASIAGFVVLIISGAMHSAAFSLFTVIVYGLCLIFVFTASALYHSTQNPVIKNRLRIMDHSGIFLMIAGTYTPVLLLIIGGTWGWAFLAIQWMLAIAGVIIKIFFTGRFEFLSLIMYLMMGWLGLLKIEYLYNTLPATGYWLLISGGLAYTSGILFYIIDHKVRFAHFIWHLFVVKGSILHFLMILLYVL